MKNGTKWTIELALELESLFYKESVAEEHIEIVDNLSRRWQAIAELIGFNFTNEDTVATIEKLFPVTDEKSPLYIFDDAMEAINFFQDMRTIKARRAWFYIRTTKDSYAPAVQALIKICCKIINDSPVEYHQRPNIPLENMIDCMSMAIGAKDITYEVLRNFHKRIHDLEKKQVEYNKRSYEKARGNQITKGKQDDVNNRKKYFKEFENYYNKRIQSGERISRHQAASGFFKQKANEEDKIFKGIWKNSESFYRAYTERNQVTKNKARDKKQQEKDSAFEIPPEQQDVLNQWLNDKKANE